MDTLWRIQLLGGLRAEGPERVITRFRTQKTAALLAYLAFYRDSSHPRDVLIEIALVPVALAFAATLIGLAWVIFG